MDSGNKGGLIPSSMRPVVRVAGAILLLLSLRMAVAGENAGEIASAETSPPDRLFAHGRYEAAFNSGVLFSPFLATHGRPTLDYTITSLQLGYMLGDVKGHGWWRGNFELAGEAFASDIFRGPGSYIAGGTLWLRYNFVPQKSPKLVPFVQGGAGMVSTDIDHRIDGQPFNFNLDVGLGVRYLAGQHWALSLECRYQHISNANMGHNNLGINAIGPILGVSYFF
jgi:lipid A 3-O-deacylase